MTRRRWLGAIVGLALAVPAVTAVAAVSPAAGGVSLSGDANSSPVETTFLEPTFSTTPLIDAQYPHAQADVASSTQATAHGSILDPGALVQTLPYEIDSNCPPPSPFPHSPPPVIGCPPFPSYPFGAEADSGHPHSSGDVQGGSAGPLTVAAGSYDLNVGDGSADAVASGGSSSLQAAQTITVTSGDAHATVRVEGDRVISSVTQRLHGVVIAGQLDIGALDSTVTTSAISGRPGSASGSLSMSGVTFAGQSASIDQNGIHLLGQTVPLPLDPAQQLLQQLEAAGLSVKLVSAVRDVKPGHSSYDGAAIVVSETFPDGTSASIRLGGARASTVAVPFALPSFAGFGGAGAISAPAGGLPPAAAPPPPSGGGGGSSVLLKVAAFRLTPLQILLAVAALLELALLGAAATLLWPRAVPSPAPTLRSL